MPGAMRLSSRGSRLLKFTNKNINQQGQQLVAQLDHATEPGLIFVSCFLECVMSDDRPEQDLSFSEQGS